MPEEVNKVVGSSPKTKGAGGIILCPLFSKNSKNFCLISLEVMRIIHNNKKTAIKKAVLKIKRR